MSKCPSLSHTHTLSTLNCILIPVIESSSVFLVCPRGITCYICRFSPKRFPRITHPLFLQHRQHHHYYHPPLHHHNLNFVHYSSWCMCVWVHFFNYSTTSGWPRTWIDFNAVGVFLLFFVSCYWRISVKFEAVML